jgi:hypothetical protein
MLCGTHANYDREGSISITFDEVKSLVKEGYTVVIPNQGIGDSWHNIQHVAPFALSLAYPGRRVTANWIPAKTERVIRIPGMTISASWCNGRSLRSVGRRVWRR